VERGRSAVPGGAGGRDAVPAVDRDPRCHHWTISLAAKRAIIIKNPAVLEQVDTCRTIIFDKTGTLTYGEPKLTDQICVPGVLPTDVLCFAASLEQYSKHPLARASSHGSRGWCQCSPGR